LKTEFKEPAHTAEKDHIFIPTGWDIQGKIAIIKDQNKKVPGDDEDYDSFISVPTIIRKRAATKVVHNVSAEDDQEFLQKQQAKEQTKPKEAARMPTKRTQPTEDPTPVPVTPVASDEIVTPRNGEQTYPNPNPNPNPGVNTRARGESQPRDPTRKTKREPSRQRVAENGVATAPEVGSTGNGNPTGNGTGGGAAPGTDTVLSSFFNSLLNRPPTKTEKGTLRRDAATALETMRSTDRKNSGAGGASPSGGTTTT